MSLLDLQALTADDADERRAANPVDSTLSLLSCDDSPLVP
jgi:hypothetical protein